MMLADVRDRAAAASDNDAPAVAAGPDGPRLLDWQAVSAAAFPGRRRHDLEALTAYSAYRRSHAAGERSREHADAEARNGVRGPSALQDWEDEGGALRA